MNWKNLLPIGLLVLLLTACNLPASTPTEEIPVPPTLQVNTQVPLVETATPTLTATILPTETPLPSPTATEFAPFNVKASVDNFNVRTNPGYLFPVLMMVQQGTELTVYGQAPGGEWIYVKTPDGVYGWVFAKLIFDEPRLSQAPIREPEKVQLVNGFLKDVKGNPISGFHFALVQGSGLNAPRNDAMTDENGEFFAYMPVNSSGVWNVSYVAYACTSNIVDADCNFLPGQNKLPDPLSIDITLPLNNPLEFIFQ
jgi:uncharacterized protein YgiM (DUF1202 family)